MASISFSCHTKQSIEEAAQRSLDGTLNLGNQMRTMNIGEAMKLSAESMNKMCEDIYCRKVIDCQHGRFNPTRFATFKRATAAFDTFIYARLMTNWERLMSHPADAVAVAVMPWAVRCAHPSHKQADAWQKRWDADGDLYKYVSSKCPNVMVFPTILYEGTDPNSLVQFAVVLIRPPL